MSQPSSDSGGQQKVRREKLELLRRQRVQPYGGTFPKAEPIQALVEAYADGKAVTTAGRLSAKRGHGGLTFADLRDANGKIQICLRQERVGEATYRFFDMLDLGDIVGVSGTLFQTKTGEVTVQVDTLRLLAKSLRPLPEKWYGLKDVEIRYRKRFLDLIANEPVRRVFFQRGRLLSTLRETLARHGFLEVETPMMHAIPGGAAGEPFVTHHNTLDMDLYLRLAPELYLKELLVGGLERVYDLNRSFRNEGLSTRHNPEFTMLEAYAAYQDYAFMMDFVQELICDAANALVGSLRFEFQGQAIDLTPPWERVSFAEAMAGMGLTPRASLDEIREVLRNRGVKVTGLSRSQLVRLVEQLFEPKTRSKPLFVVDYWTELSPLAKAKPDNPLITERFELFIGGMEIANAYSELNDPIEQRRRFEVQLDAAEGSRLKAEGKGRKGNRLEPRALNLERRIDESFLEALEYGMPPAGGLGVGVDRLAMLLLNQPSIKDVILFPLLKPASC
ncbi:MAG: lysine--tRNA ligase [Candidatus Omnitrophica bacterium]|nr:lysine--tRNA ligase [Candidatus Omnitrophota bacterium]